MHDLNNTAIKHKFADSVFVCPFAQNRPWILNHVASLSRYLEVNQPVILWRDDKIITHCWRRTWILHRIIILFGLIVYIHCTRIVVNKTHYTGEICSCETSRMQVTTEQLSFWHLRAAICSSFAVMNMVKKRERSLQEWKNKEQKTLRDRRSEYFLSKGLLVSN
jgi:hypothetical protein